MKLCCRHGTHMESQINFGHLDAVVVGQQMPQIDIREIFLSFSFVVLLFKISIKSSSSITLLLAATSCRETPPLLNFT